MVAPRHVWPVISFGASLACWYEHISRTICLLICKNHRLWEFLAKLVTRNRFNPNLPSSNSSYLQPHLPLLPLWAFFSSFCVWCPQDSPYIVKSIFANIFTEKKKKNTWIKINITHIDKFIKNRKMEEALDLVDWLDPTLHMVHFKGVLYTWSWPNRCLGATSFLHPWHGAVFHLSSCLKLK